jgi:hypothetical protein
MDSSESLLAPLLFSNGPASDRADKMSLSGWLIGTWTLDVKRHNPAMHAPNGEIRERRGDIALAWILQGRAIQDVWILPDFFYGTTLHVYDSEASGVEPLPDTIQQPTSTYFDTAAQAWRAKWLRFVKTY